MSPSALRFVLAIAKCGGTVIFGWAGYALVAWFRYGRPRPRHDDRLLDRFMPEYEVAERHETPVAAPADVTYRTACEFDLRDSPLIRAIFRARELILRAPAAPETAPTQFLALTLQSGWRILAEEPGRELVVGTITRPWEAHVTFRPLAPDEFAAFDKPNAVKIAWTLSVDPVDDRSSVFRTVTRVRTTDPCSREKFRRYWAVFSPGIVLIRYEALRIVRTQAALRYRGNGQ